MEVVRRIPVIGRWGREKQNRGKACVLHLVGFGFNSPLRQYFSLYRAVS